MEGEQCGNRLGAFTIPLESEFNSMIKRSWILFLAINCQAATYYVTQTGSGAETGTNLAKAWSVADFNSTSTPTGGDTVFFSGVITSHIVINCRGTGNGSQRLTLDFTSAVLNQAVANEAGPRINVNGQAYLNLYGGVMGTAGTAGCDTPNGMINFGGGGAHDLTVSGWSHVGDPLGTAYFIVHQYAYNTVIENNSVDDVGQFLWGDSTRNHNILIQNNYARTSVSSAQDIDVIQMGDAYHVTIQGNKLVNRAVGTSTAHQDVIQCYEKGGSDAGHPTKWVIRYNWIETGSVGGSGDNSWLMMESMHGDPACKIYGNVFFGPPTANEANNGVCFNGNVSTGVFYFFNNTVVRTAVPNNTIRFLAPGTLHAKNNIGMAAVPVSGNCIDWSMVNAGWDFNFFYHFNGAGGVDAGPHGSTVINPKFNNIANGDFSLSASSPLIGRADSKVGSEYSKGIAPGATWPNPALVTRPAGDWDVGAYQ